MTAGPSPLPPRPASGQAAHTARAHLTSQYATGLDDFLWESIKRPLPDHDALTAVLSAAIRGQSGRGVPVPAADIGAAMAVLAAARMDLDRIEARLLETAQGGTGWTTIARILGLTRAALDEYVRRLRSHLDGPETA